MKGLVSTVLQPLFFRLGSMLSGALIALGMAAEHGPTIQTAVTVVGLLAVELIARKTLRGRK